jgi:hypothetical protein
MDKEARADLLRSRLAALRPKGTAPSPNEPKRPKAQPYQAKAAPNRRGMLGVQQVFPHDKWMTEPDAKGPEKELGAKNRREVSPLTQIAAKWRRFSA